MKVLFACGGSAGHINPALAMAQMLTARRPESEIHFAGAKGDLLAARLIPAAGYELRLLNVNSFRRSLRPKALRHNIKALYNIPRARMQARHLLRELRPDLVVGTGGFATYAVLREAAGRGIPTAIHESNVVPGLATKGLSRHVDKIMVAFEAARAQYKHPARVVVTGTPVRPAFFQKTRRQARAELGFDPDVPLLVSFWGSLGASEMNRQMADFIAMECAAPAPRFRHIHGAGGGYETLLEQLRDRGVALERHPEVEVREYISDMPGVMAAADLVLCRAGASTISELIARAVPSILIPSPNVTGDHQTPNARLLAEQGGAILLPEPECTPQILYEAATALLHDPQRRREMAGGLSALTPPDALERIFEVFLALTNH